MKALLIILTVFLISCATGNVIVGDDKYNVKIANTPESRAKGLMNVESMPINEGMLFVFEEEKLQSFWMKNTLISLDILFINSSYHIVHKVTAHPCKYDPCPTFNSRHPIKYVLEINSELAKNYKIGDKVNIK